MVMGCRIAASLTAIMTASPTSSMPKAPIRGTTDVQTIDTDSDGVGTDDYNEALDIDGNGAG